MTAKSAIAPLAALFVLCLASTGAMAADKFTTIYSFPDTAAANPWAGLARDSKGNLYGTVLNGGITDMVVCPQGCGSVFQLVPPGGSKTEWTRRIIHRFEPATGGISYSNLAVGPDGALYGFTAYGGSVNQGVAYRLIPPGGAADRAAAWTYQVLHEFGGKTGGNPFGDILVDSKGAVYGMTYGASMSDLGTVFKLTPKASPPWKATVLHKFTGADGSSPQGGLVMDTKGMLYGVTSYGGAKDKGVLFSVTPPPKSKAAAEWTYKIIHTFRGGANDGSGPLGSLVLKEGALYGTTSAGGENDKGTIYRIVLPRTFDLMWSFEGSTQGSFPYTGLTAGADGAFYGINYLEGPGNQGTLFRIIPKLDGWMLSVPHAFTGAPDGDDATGTLIVDDKGVLYGTTNYGGANDKGMVFTFKP